MFRLANTDNDSKLAKYLSPIISSTIYNALERWAPDDYDIDVICKELYTDFFDGISRYIKPTEEMRKRWGAVLASELPHSKIVKIGRAASADDDTVLAHEILFRKIFRMKEKMADRTALYTFDLLEEHIFAELIVSMRFLSIGDHSNNMSVFSPEFFEEHEELLTEIAEKGPQKFEELMRRKDFREMMLDGIMDAFFYAESAPLILKDEEQAVADTLMKEYGFSEGAAVYTAAQCFRIEEIPLMGEEEEILEDEYMENLFFWDDDYGMIFEEGFVKGIRELVSGVGTMLGYTYENVCEIFTDISFKRPLGLVGTAAAAEAWRETAFERMASLPVPPVPSVSSLHSGDEENPKKPFDTYKPENAEIAARIRELRKKTGLTIKDFAASIGVSGASVSNYENGKIKPSENTMRKIAEKYGGDWMGEDGV